MRLFPNRKGYFRQQNYKSLLTYQKRMDFFWKMSGGGERKMPSSVAHTSYLKTAISASPRNITPDEPSGVQNSSFNISWIVAIC